MNTIEDRLKELNIELPPVPAKGGNYEHSVQTGNLLYLSGKGPQPGAIGKVSSEVSVEDAYQHARQVGLALIAVMKEDLGSLDRVTRIVKVLGMGNTDPDFNDHPRVINGCSDLFVEVCGDKGKHARSAVGFGALPGRISVEIEVIVEVTD